jgi:hypothetical protein
MVPEKSVRSGRNRYPDGLTALERTTSEGHLREMDPERGMRWIGSSISLPAEVFECIPPWFNNLAIVIGRGFRTSSGDGRAGR